MLLKGRLTMIGDFITLVRQELGLFESQMRANGVKIQVGAEIHLDPAPVLASEYRITDSLPNDTLIVTARVCNTNGDTKKILRVSMEAGDKYHLPVDVQKRIIQALVLDWITRQLADE